MDPQDEFMPAWSAAPAPTARPSAPVVTDAMVIAARAEWPNAHRLPVEKAWRAVLTAALAASKPEVAPVAVPAVPLTEAQIDALLPEADGSAEVNVQRVEVLPGVMGTEYDTADAWSLPLVREAVRAAERAHGITATQEPT